MARVPLLRWTGRTSSASVIKLGLGWSGVRVPRFEEVLDAADSRAGINIHIKEPGSEGQLVKLVCDLLRARGLSQMHYIAGDEPALEVALNLCTGNPAGVSDCTERAAAYSQGCTRVQFGRNAADEVLRRYAHHLGLICNLFWSDELTKAQGYMEMGVDLVLTNATHKLLSLVSPPNR